MKSANSIIEHIKNLPQFKPLHDYYCYNRYISLFSKRHQKFISFAYIKNDTLYLAVSHHGVKWELNSNQQLLKSLLTVLRNREEKCKSVKASSFVCFTPKSKRTDLPKMSPITYYKERSTGTFEVNCRDKDIEKKIQDIAKIIRSRESNLGI
jgi:hypothetical protein